MATTIIADWKLEQTCNRVFGVCYIEFSPPFDKFDFTQGFALSNPTHYRCALQAIITSIEAIQGCSFLKESQCIILATKHDIAYKFLTDPAYVCKWVTNNSWPRSQLTNKALLSKAFKMLETLDKNVVTFVYVERDEEDKAYIDLDKGRTKDDLDKISQKMDPDEIETELRDTRMRGVMAQKLIGTGAKSFRTIKKKE